MTCSLFVLSDALRLIPAVPNAPSLSHIATGMYSVLILFLHQKSFKPLYYSTGGCLFGLEELQVFCQVDSLVLVLSFKPCFMDRRLMSHKKIGASNHGL